MFLNILSSHKEWRKLAKKLRRKRLRQKRAQARDAKEGEEETKRLASPTYQQWLVKQREDEEFEKLEENRLAKEEHANWLRIENEAQIQWRELQKRLELIKNERTKQQILIKQQWEKEEEKLRRIKLEKEIALREKLKQEEDLQKSIESYIRNGTELPDALKLVHETNPGKETCPFYLKTAACRFRNTCSRNHIRPTVSSVLIIRNFYTHYSLDRTVENEHGSDSGLEFEHAEVYSHFKDFFDDVLTEMEQIGRVQQFKVCSNKGAHLRGNVYIEYRSGREAIMSYRTFHGRFYAGKQITVEFCNISSWKNAICGLFAANKCPKGDQCNYLHPFRNPRNLFRQADLDQHISSRKSFENDCTSGKYWRWSESPEMDRSDERKSRKRKKSPSKLRIKDESSRKYKRYSSKSTRRSESDRNSSRRKNN